MRVNKRILSAAVCSSCVVMLRFFLRSLLLSIVSFPLVDVTFVYSLASFCCCCWFGRSSKPEPNSPLRNGVVWQVSPAHDHTGFHLLHGFLHFVGGFLLHFQSQKRHKKNNPTKALKMIRLFFNPTGQVRFLWAAAVTQHLSPHTRTHAPHSTTVRLIIELDEMLLNIR